MLNLTIFIIIAAIICVIAIIVSAIRSYKEFKISWKTIHKQDNKNLSQDALHTKLDLATYSSLLDVFKYLNQYRASIKEIIDLIENNAEVGYSILNEKSKNKDYVSSNVLVFWLESYYNQFRSYITYTLDVFYNIKDKLAYDVYIRLRDNLTELTEYCDYVRDYYKNISNRKEI